MEREKNTTNVLLNLTIEWKTTFAFFVKTNLLMKSKLMMKQCIVGHALPTERIKVIPDLR